MFTLLFVAFLLIDVLLRLWLASRQVRHVRLHRDHIPDAFTTRISLYSHQRAADYTVAKMRLLMVERLVEVVVLLGFTLLGGLQVIDTLLGNVFESEMLRQLALLSVVFAIMGVIGLPFAFYNKFRLEQRFGFNRMTPRLFILDSFKTLLLSLLFGLPLAAAVLWVMGNTGTAWAWWAWGI
ncbi:MAG: M48 family peptidase, partial [Alcaligenaceae bacterium]|nr:M48 family peptidase [Alcaligenaceae bacterium]